MTDIFEKFKHILRGGGSGSPAVHGPVEYIVAGLGNPGRDYELTRHNAGFLAVDHCAEKCGAKIQKLKFKSLCGEAMLADRRVLLLKPSTFMNKSGEAVREAMQFYKIPPERLIVLSDDIALDVGKMRIRRSGSDGGQKGLRSIIYLTGRDDFPRIRIGIGKKPHPDMELADWVLSRFSPDEMKSIEPMLENAFSAIRLIVQGDIDQAMSKFN